MSGFQVAQPRRRLPTSPTMKMLRQTRKLCIANLIFAGHQFHPFPDSLEGGGDDDDLISNNWSPGTNLKASVYTRLHIPCGATSERLRGTPKATRVGSPTFQSISERGVKFLAQLKPSLPGGRKTLTLRLPHLRLSQDRTRRERRPHKLTGSQGSNSERGGFSPCYGQDVRLQWKPYLQGNYWSACPSGRGEKSSKIRPRRVLDSDMEEILAFRGRFSMATAVDIENFERISQRLAAPASIVSIARINSPGRSCVLPKL